MDTFDILTALVVWTPCVLILSAAFNAFLLWRLILAQDTITQMRAAADGWRAAIDLWRRMYENANRNCSRRDPKTGRFIKKGN